MKGRSTTCSILCSAALSLSLSCGADGSGGRRFPLSTLTTAEVAVEGRAWRVWLADTPDKRAEGLMHVPESELPDDRGMLFVYPTAAPRSFWMRGTPTPLDIVYIGADKKVVSVAHGRPNDATPLPSGGPAQFVFEVRHGVAASAGLTPGVAVTIPSGLNARD